MGTNLAPIISRENTSLNALRGKSLAIDGANCLYQFLSVIRLNYGIPLRDGRGNPTSHLTGLAFRSTRLISDYDIKLVFVFDGQPPKLKSEEIKRRSELRMQAKKDWTEAVKIGDRAKAFSKAVTATRLTRSMIEDAKMLLNYLGIPFVMAPGEGEAQAAHMANIGAVWAANSRDYDLLLFGAPRLARYITISGTKFLPSKGITRKLRPELVYLKKTLSNLEITQNQLIDLAILIGTDYNQGVKGIGPKNALKMIKEYVEIEQLPKEVKDQVDPQYQEVRQLFMCPDVTDDFRTNYGTFNEEGLYSFLVDDHSFTPKRVETVAKRMRKFYSSRSQTGLRTWF